MTNTIIRRLVCALALAAGCFIAQAAPAQQQPGVDREQQIADEQKSAFEAAKKVAQRGPASVPLGGQGTFNIPENMVFVPQPEAGRVLRAMGNNPSPLLMGVVWPTGEDDNWLATVQFVKSGYIKDGDAKNWNVSELLQSLKDGTEEGNKDRVARGFKPFEVVGWVERPDYDAVNHRLVWAINGHDKGVPSSDDDSINYNTYALGREGYFSLNFVTDSKSIEAQKPIARQLLANLSFSSGKTYADYNAVTDHAAEFGIGALIAGGAAKKLGLFAVIAAFVAKAGKLLIIPLIAVGIGLRKLFSRNRGEA